MSSDTKSKANLPKRVVLLYTISGLRGILTRITGQPFKILEHSPDSFTRAEKSAFFTASPRVETHHGIYHKESGIYTDHIYDYHSAGKIIKVRQLAYSREDDAQRAMREGIENMQREEIRRKIQ